MGTLFKWRKQGQILAPAGQREWLQSHGQNPSALILDDRLRIFFTCRPRPDADGNFASVIARIDVDRANPQKILELPTEPVLTPGGPGTFDQFGVMPSPVLRVGDELWLYYVGWARCRGVPYHHAIGLAISKDDGRTFRRYGPGPVITRTPEEPFIHNSQFVTRIGDLFHIWYGCGVAWVEGERGRMESIYVMKHATSRDGLHWDREAGSCMPAKVEHECHANPCVIYRNGRYHIWFSYRWGLDFRNAQRSYRIGYAWSTDLQHWQRDDQAGDLEPSPSGWDSEMVCYPWVTTVDGRTIMLYSGNGFGRDGFGYAVLDES